MGHGLSTLEVVLNRKEKNHTTMEEAEEQTSKQFGLRNNTTTKAQNLRDFSLIESDIVNCTGPNWIQKTTEGRKLLTSF